MNSSLSLVVPPEIGQRQRHGKQSSLGIGVRAVAVRRRLLDGIILSANDSQMFAIDRNVSLSE
jgi:hypothetical protein